MPNITIQVLTTSNETKPTAKGSYNMLEVVYKNLTFQGKVEPKKLASFGASAGAYTTLVEAKQGDVYEVEYSKNAAGFNDWTKVTKSVTGAQIGGQDTSSTVTQRATSNVGNVSPKSTYETPEERAKKQIYIVRQSSISNAIESLTPGSKAALDPSKVIEVAKTFEDYVFGSGTVTPNDQTANKLLKDIGDSFGELESDIPF